MESKTRRHEGYEEKKVEARRTVSSFVPLVSLYFDRFAFPCLVVFALFGLHPFASADELNELPLEGWKQLREVERYQLQVAEKYWREHVRNMLRGMDAHSAPTFLLDPIAARQFIDRGGFDTKEKLIDWVYENALMPAGEYWDYQLIQNYIYPRATFGEEPYASKLKAAPEEMVRMFKPDEIHVVVVGGETNGYWRIMGCSYQKTVSVDAWR